MSRRLTHGDLPPTAEVELIALVVAAERFADVLQLEAPPVPNTLGLVRAIVRAHRRRNEAASQN